ncbi:MAG: rod shape-determining protein [Clostridia bacterium]|nr:rod shape-determining protein [Clostridia bacterium]MBR4979262.1 rod shape-determining protein [Clostridia bacterium]
MNDIAIDLGTATVLVYVKGKGVVYEEPSVVAVDRASGKVLKIGKEAQLMLGRTPGNILAVRPLQDGVISQYEVTMKMLKHFIRKATGPSLLKPRVMVCVPSGITEVEERAVYDATIAAGAKKTYLIEEPIAAAIGAGIDISKPEGHIIVDIGGGTTDVAVISLGSIVVSDSLKLAGNKIDEAIIKYIRRKYNVLIGEVTAEEIKKKLGAAIPYDNQYIMEVKGRCLKEGLPKMITISSDEVADAVAPTARAIADAVCHVIERTPPELVGDIAANGIVMTGGGSLLYGMDKLIEKACGIKTYIADNPTTCVVIGTGRSLDNLQVLPEGIINISRQRQERL